MINTKMPNTRIELAAARLGPRFRSATHAARYMFYPLRWVGSRMHGQ